MSDTFEDMERRLRAALAPIEPPVHLQRQLEQTLDSIVELAADELETWELSAIKDPRNWPRAAVGPATAVVVGSGAAVGLVVPAHTAQAPQTKGRRTRRPRPRGPHVA